MINVSMLQGDDLLMPTDWCRPLTLTTMMGGHSDYYAFESCYTGQPENNVKWVTTEQIFDDGWMFKPLRELNKHLEKHGDPYEFIRGDIPLSHQYGPTLRDKRHNYALYLKNTTIKFGKHKGKTIYHVQQYYHEYYDWAVHNGIFISFERFSSKIDDEWFKRTN